MSGSCTVVDPPEADWPSTVAVMEEIVALLRVELTRLWGAYFPEGVEPFLPPEFVYLRSGGTTNYDDVCGSKWLSVTPDTCDAYFCPDVVGKLHDGSSYDGRVILPIDALTRVLNGCVWNTELQMEELGDDVREQLMLFAIGLVAHEYGHAVQKYKQTAQSLLLPEAPRDELLSDCIAGDFVWRIEQKICPIDSLRAQLDQESKNQIRRDGYAAIGDRPGAISHGTGQERLDAFELGYSSAAAVPSNPADICFSTYI